MRQLAHDLGVAGRVTFHEGYSGQEYIERLHTSDVYLLPSVRETAGITMMEAMLAGCYSIVLSGTGAGEIVERTGGAALEAKDPEEAIAKITAQLEWCHHHRNEMAQRAQEGAGKVRTLYSENAYRNSIPAIYSDAIDKHRAVARH
jgi:glycosyltransferase involved in cell wall biosynthesis